MSTDSLYALRSAALMGLGAAVASAWLLRDDLAAKRLVHLAPAWRADPLPVHLIYPKAPFYAARLRRFIEMMKEAIPSVVSGAGNEAKLPGPRIGAKPRRGQVRPASNKRL